LKNLWDTFRFLFFFFSASWGTLIGYLLSWSSERNASIARRKDQFDLHFLAFPLFHILSTSLERWKKRDFGAQKQLREDRKVGGEPRRAEYRGFKKRIHGRDGYLISVSSQSWLASRDTTGRRLKLAAGSFEERPSLVEHDASLVSVNFPRRSSSRRLGLFINEKPLFWGIPQGWKRRLRPGTEGGRKRERTQESERDLILPGPERSAC